MDSKYLLLVAGLFGLVQYFTIKEQFVRLILGGLLI